MHITLSETGRAHTRSAVGTVVSVILHATLFIVVAAGVGISGTRPPEAPHGDIIVYTPTPRDPHPARPTTRGSTPQLRNSSGPPILRTDIDVPMTNLPVLIDATVFDGRPHLQNEFGHAAIATSGEMASAGASVAELFEASTVEIPVRVLGTQAPRYPLILASAGVEGRVVVRYVVDTLGHVEPGSIATVSATHVLFERSVREALARFRFASAEVGGRKVRQLVEQSFGFERSR